MKRFREWLYVQWIANPLTGVVIFVLFTIVSVLMYINVFSRGNKEIGSLAAAWIALLLTLIIFSLDWWENHGR